MERTPSATHGGNGTKYGWWVAHVLRLTAARITRSDWNATDKTSVLQLHSNVQKLKHLLPVSCVGVVCLHTGSLQQINVGRFDHTILVAIPLLR